METSKTSKFTSTKRKIAIIVAALLAATLAIGGTYAWQSLSTGMLNEATGEPGPAGGRLHDDFEYVGEGATKQKWATGVSANKDIYVENYESAANGGRDIFVRVKLYEYMETGQGASLSLDDAGYDTRSVESLVALASRDDVTTWSVANPYADSQSDPFRARISWDMGGQKMYMPTFNKDNMSDEGDMKGGAKDLTALPAGEQENSTKAGQAYPYAQTAGESTYFETNTTHSATEKTYDKENALHVMGTDLATHTSKQTKAGTVITMQQWKTTYNSQAGDFWVIDTDGWVYWASALEAESATGLLLDSITLIGEPSEEWYYGIYVKSEMATSEDWTMQAQGQGFYANPQEAPSSDAENLLNIITGHLPTVISVDIASSAYAAQVDSTLTLTATVETEYTTDLAYEAITWTIVPDVGARFNNGVFTPSAADSGKWFSVTATSVKDPSIKDTAQVYVAPVGRSTIIGADGAIYLVSSPDDNTYQKVNADGSFGLLICPVSVGQPGLATDRAVITKYGQKVLAAENGFFDIVGSDGLLGTADDPLRRDDGSALVVPDTVVSLTVTASPAATAMQGQGITLTASATFNGVTQDSTDITWAVLSAPQSSISPATGTSTTFTPGASQAVGTVVVRATKPAGAGYPAATKDVTITVISAGPIPYGATSFTDNGVVWRVLKDNRPFSGTSVSNDFGISTTSTGDGSVLMITDTVYDSNGTEGWQRYNLKYSTNNNAYSSYETSTGNFRIFNDNFYKDSVSSTLKTFARIPVLKYEGGWAPEAMTEALSLPGAAAGSTTTGVLFPLSFSETNSYIGTSTADWTAYDTEGDLRGWFLRSVSNIPTAATLLDYDGHPRAANNNDASASRPALWLDATP